MNFDIGFIKAETHTAEYLMHKYWARKPHNVISRCIERLTKKGDIVLDPFCGSGVVIREGALLSRKCIGIDINPLAVLISNVLLTPPSAKEFSKVFESIYEQVYAKYGNLYLTNDGRYIKYLAHRIIVKCDCGLILKQSECIKKGKKFICPTCGQIIHFNLESLADTEVFNICAENDKSYIATNAELKRQEKMSCYTDNSVDVAQFNFKFPENRRILAFKGIQTAAFFTKRNYCVLSCFASEIWKIKDETLRNCALLLLTSSVAQCSRLIAHRNNLSTGGPAWSVPGFWIPQEHLETNPFVYLKSRLTKFKKALIELERKPIENSASVFRGDSLKLLDDEFHNLKANLIFLDPPYGDNVPYTEFSNIWNSFLKKIPCSDDDISVSDRIDKTASWNNYYRKLDQYMACLSRHIASEGKMLITFNNNNIRAWTALIGALQNNSFVCRSVFYQIPAVISSKAQMSINSSYISDVYSVYTFSPSESPSKDMSPLLSHLCFIANSRGGIVSKTVIDREFIIAWLKNNLDHHKLREKAEIISSIFDFDKGTNLYRLKTSYKKTIPQLEDAIKNTLNILLKDGPLLLLDAYMRLNEILQEYGIMELGEFKNYISEYVVENGKVYGSTQMLFKI